MAMDLYIFKESFVHSLQASILMNISRYQRNSSWVHEIGTQTTRQVPAAVDLLGEISLINPKGDKLMDVENAIRIHKAFRKLTPLQAQDPRLWTRLAHCEHWKYMRIRWPIEKHLSDKEKTYRYILAHYFVQQRQSRALLRNGIARLWWAAQVSFDAERENPYELTGVLLSNLDITQQILERGLGRAPSVMRGFLEFLFRNKDTLLVGGNINRRRIRHLAKYLNLRGGISILDSFGTTEVIGILEEELDRCMEAETRGN